MLERNKNPITKKIESRSPQIEQIYVPNKKLISGDRG